jgi:hypothetical protein
MGSFGKDVLLEEGGGVERLHTNGLRRLFRTIPFDVLIFELRE